jgi:hypothetical protein
MSPRLTEPWPLRLVVLSGHASDASLPLHWFKKLPSVFRRGPEEAHYRRVRLFALSAPEIRHPRSMTRGVRLAHVEVLDQPWRSGLYIQGSGTLPWGSGLTVEALGYITFSGHVAAPDPPMWWG